MSVITANTGSNAWNTNGCWVGGVQPSAADDVVIPASAIVTLPTATTCVGRSLTVAASGTLIWASTTAVLTLGDGTAGAGNVALNISSTATITLTGIGTLNFVSTNATQQTITTGGKTLPTYTLNGAGSSYLLSDGNTSSGQVTHTQGTFNTGGQTCSWLRFSSAGAIARVFTLTSSAITITDSTLAWNTNGATNLTLNVTGSTITMNNGQGQFAASSNQVFNNIVMSSLSSSSANFIGTGTTWSCANLTIIGSAVRTATCVVASGTITVTNSLTISGNSSINRILILSSAAGTARTFALGASAIFRTSSTQNVDFQDITVSGGAVNERDLSAITGGSGDCLGNSGITFTPSATQTATGTASFTWSTHGWTTRVPLPQDDVVVNNTFIAGRTITTDMPRLGRNIDFTGVSGSPAVSLGSGGGSATCFGSITFAAGLGAITLLAALTPLGRSSHTFTSAGKTLGPSSLQFTGIGTYVLQDDLVVNGSISVSSVGGTLNSAGFSMTCTTFASGGGNGTWISGGSTVTLTSTAVANIVTLSNQTVTGTPSFIVSTVSANTRTFVGSSSGPWGTLTYTLAGSTGQLNIVGSNRFNTINFSDTTNARTLAFTAGTTTTITTAFNANGTPGKLMTVTSITAATHTLSKAINIVSCDYLSVSNSIASGGAAWYAGANSTNGGGNTGWLFLPAIKYMTSRSKFLK